MFVSIELVKAGLPKLSCHRGGCGTSSGNETPQKHCDSPAVAHLSSAPVPLSTALPVLSRETALPVYSEYRLQTQSACFSSFHATTIMNCSS